MLWLATGPAKDNQTLAEVLKADPDTVRQAITRLQEKGYVTFNYQRNAHGGRPRFVEVRTETPPRSTWPILDALRTRMRGLDPLRIAANALDKDDPLRKDIETRIEMASKALTPAEQEYMDYAARHPGPKA
jgi:predicted ArsR family transcriptional regulator